MKHHDWFTSNRVVTNEGSQESPNDPGSCQDFGCYPKATAHIAEDSAYRTHLHEEIELVPTWSLYPYVFQHSAQYQKKIKEKET